MAKPRVSKARRRRRLPRQGTGATRAEYNRILSILNECRQAIDELRSASDMHFKRVAQIQADLDGIKQAWTKIQ